MKKTPIAGTAVKKSKKIDRIISMPSIREKNRGRPNLLRSFLLYEKLIKYARIKGLNKEYINRHKILHITFWVLRCYCYDGHM